MVWDIFSNAFADTRILILIGILVFFVVLGGLIVLYELRNKKKIKETFSKKVEDVRIVHLREGLLGATTAKEKLSVIDAQAKGLFAERFSLSKNKSYADLVEHFDRGDDYDFSVFCQRMFAVYYSGEVVSESMIKELLLLLTRLIRQNSSTLDPETYDLENIYPSHALPIDKRAPEAKDDKQDDIRSVTKHDHSHYKKVRRLDDEKRKLSKIEASIDEKRKAIAEKEKLVRLREKEIVKKEKENNRVLLHIDRKLREQERKIKAQEYIQKKIEGQLEKEEKQKEKIIKSVHRNSEVENAWRLKKLQEHWTEDVEIESIEGREWLRSHLDHKKGKK
ncbi:MAG: hypothetical protein ACI83O_000601 [Patescibacteria group bacterium]|jgi:hypothetical protein